jgi:hypothetical protein
MFTSRRGVTPQSRDRGAACASKQWRHDIQPLHAPRHREGRIVTFAQLAGRRERTRRAVEMWRNGEEISPEHLRRLQAELEAIELEIERRCIPLLTEVVGTVAVPALSARTGSETLRR